MKKKTTMTVLDSRMLAQDIWSLELAYAPEDLPDEVRPGQFAGLFPAGGEMLLMRPISICRWDRDRGVLRFVYRAAGKGTQSFTALKKGDRMDMLGILGNGYDLNALRGRHVLLLGGGIGVPPMLELAAALHDTADAGTRVTAVMGYRNSELFLREEMDAGIDPMELLYPKEVPVFDKYDDILPGELVRRGFAFGVLDIEGLKQRILEWTG